MKSILKGEEIAMTIFAIYYITTFDLEWPLWLWIILFFSPDISMLGYLINNKIGAYSYNLFHHKGIALLITGIGVFISFDQLIGAGILLFAHSSFDRIWGYGLKYISGFKETHLGKL